MNNTLLPYAIVTIISALVFYTIGVWSEKFAGRLKPWHLLLFWIGFVFDTTGTTLMGTIAGRFDFDIHGITGMTAILLMIIHAIWATVVLARKNEKAITNFHKFSIIVWIIWLIPYFNGFFAGMHR